MERPFFSLSKSKRMKPIEYTTTMMVSSSSFSLIKTTAWRPSGTRISHLGGVGALRHEKPRMNDIPREIKFQPHDLLRAIGRTTGGTDYLQLRGSLRLNRQLSPPTSASRGATEAHHLQLDRPVGRPDRLADKGEQGAQPHAIRLVLPRRDGGGGGVVNRPRPLLDQWRPRALALPGRTQTCRG